MDWIIFVTISCKIKIECGKLYIIFIFKKLGIYIAGCHLCLKSENISLIYLPLYPYFYVAWILKAWKRNQCWVCIVQYLQSVKTATLKQGIIQFSIVQLIYVKCCFTIILQLHQKWNLLWFFFIVLYIIIMKKKWAIDLFQILLNSNYLELF